MEVLVLRVDAPLASFGGPLVDQHGFTELFPGQAMVTGLLANALGYDHSEAARLEELQARLRFAARWDVAPRRTVDYQTVDLSQPKMASPGWTTRGTPEHRAGGPASKGTHQRYRHYLEDGLLTLLVHLTEGQGPDLAALREALAAPARPLFLGRKPCLPARPLLDPETPVREGPGFLPLLREIPCWDRTGAVAPPPRVLVSLPDPLADGGELRGARRRILFDRREWTTQLPAGTSIRWEGYLTPERQP